MKAALGSRSTAPNILFFSSEDQGAHLSFLNTPGLITPHLDRTAKSGVYFDLIERHSGTKMILPPGSVAAQDDRTLHNYLDRVDGRSFANLVFKPQSKGDREFGVAEYDREKTRLLDALRQWCRGTNDDSIDDL